MHFPYRHLRRNESVCVLARRAIDPGPRGSEQDCGVFDLNAVLS